MTTYTAPPNTSNLVLNSGDVLNVENGGTSSRTTINGGGIENVEAGGAATGTSINSGGVENVSGSFIALGTSTGTTINSGGVENVDFLGKSTGTTINGGGVENVSENDSFSTGTTINNGGVENVSDYGSSSGTIINSGGVENVYGPFASSGNTTINNGGVENVMATENGNATNVTFGNQNGGINSNPVLGSLIHALSTLSLHAAPGGTLNLEQPQALGGTISNWHVGDVVDFLNTAVTGVQENAAHTSLTVTYGANETASYSLAGQQANTKFQLQSDGHGGTDLVLTPSTPIVGVGGHDPSAGHHPFG